MAKNDSNNKEDYKGIMSTITNFNKNLSDLEYKVDGSLKNKIPNNLDKKINNLANELEHNCNGDILGSLISISRDTNASEAKKLANIKATIKDNTDNNIMQTLLNDMNSTVAKYEDLILITSIMPQLKDARKGIVNSILSPDDVTKKVALNLDLYGKPLTVKDETEFYNEIKRIMDEVEFTKKLKHGIDRSITLGKYYYAVLPYSDLYSEIINRNSNKTGRLKESTESSKLNEQSVVILDEEEFKQNLDAGYTIPSVKQSMASFVNDNVIVNESSLGLFDLDILTEDIKHAIKKTERSKNKDVKSNDSASDFENYASKFFMDKKTKNTKTVSDGLLDINAELDDKNKPNIKGCKIKKLDPRRLIPLKIDDTCFGYYYIENKRSVQAIQNPLKFRLKNDLNRSQVDSSIDTIYKSLGELMIKKIDKKFIEKNNEIKDKLYDIIKNYEDGLQQYSITYLNPDDVVEFEVDDGESPFEQSLYFSKLYMLVLLSSITAKVTRSNDVRAYYIDVDAKGPANGMIMNAINTIKRQNKSIAYYNNIQKIMSSTTVFDDLFLPKPVDGKHPIDYDIIQGQNVDIPTDVLEMLEKIAVDSTGLPLQLIQSSNDADFAKTYSMLNIKYLKRIVDFQVDLNPATTSFLSKILCCYFDKDSDEYSKARAITANLQSPINLQLSNSLDQINNAKEYATAVVDIRLGSSDKYSDEIRDKLNYELVKKNTPNIDWDAVDNILEQLLNNSVVDSIKAGDEGTGDDANVNMDDL